MIFEFLRIMLPEARPLGVPKGENPNNTPYKGKEKDTNAQLG